MPIPRDRTPAERESEATTLITELIAQPRRDAMWMFVRIRQQLLGDPDAAPWLAAAHSLRERGVIGDDVLRYLAGIFVECIAAHASDTDPALCAIREEMVAMELAAGLGADESWTRDEAPAAWRDLDERWNSRSDAVSAEYLRSHGHEALADEMERAPQAYADAAAAGRMALWGSGGTDGA